MKEVRFSNESKEREEDEMSPEVAERLYKEGGFYIVKDLPAGTEFGCDMKSWNTGEKFLGLKMLPPGVHYIYYSPVGKEKNVAPRRGFFIHISTGQLIVHRFDVQHEEILDDVPEEEVGRFKSNLKNIDGQLGAYPFNLWSKWVSLTNRINCDSLKKYQVTQTPGSLDAQLKFTEVSKRTYPEGASAAEISLHNLDSSYQLETFLKNHTSIDGVLTELQLAFTLFLIGQDYESFNHWKLVVDMMCGCGKALIKYPNLFKNFIKDLHFQLREVPEDFFFDIISSNNFLVAALTNLFENIREYEANQELKMKAISFENNLSKKFGWTFSDDVNDENAPVVVELG